MTNCKFCNRIKKHSNPFCSKRCKNNYQHFSKIGNPELEFYSYTQASKYFERDVRTVKKQENRFFKINKIEALDSSIKWINCKFCNKKVPKSKARVKICKECSKQGLGRQNQAKIISKLQKGKNNSNYIHGKSKQNIYRTKEWKMLKKELDVQECSTCNTKKENCVITHHHIIPRWFCILTDIDVYDKNNVIGLCENCHYKLHKALLDIKYVPYFYEKYQENKEQIKTVFINHPLNSEIKKIKIDETKEKNLHVGFYKSASQLKKMLPEQLSYIFNH